MTSAATAARQLVRPASPSPGTAPARLDAELVVGPDLRIRAWSDGAAVLTGLRAAQIVGRRCEDVLRAVAGAAGGGGLAVRLRPLPARSGRGQWNGANGANGANGSQPAAATPVTQPATLVDLTPRQREVLGLLGQGLPARAIAKRLWVSETTVRNHIRAIFLELGVHSQLGAVVKAARLGVIPPIGPTAPGASDA